MNMKWNILSGDVNWETYGGKLVSPPQSNGEFTYWLVLDVLEWEQTVGEREAAEIDGTHHVSLCVVAPSELGEDKMRSALRNCGWDGGDGPEIDDPLMLVDILHSYGTYATVWQADGGLRDLLREGKQQAEITSGIMFGFQMDQPQNRIGADGWDFIRGEVYPPAMKAM
jgi:hypothetical protein